MNRSIITVSGLTLLMLAVGCGGNNRSSSAAAGSTSAPVSSGSGTGTGTGTGTTSGGSTSGGTTGGGTTGGGTTTPPPVIGGTGVFTDGSALLPTSSSVDWTVSAGDVDGDGDDDLVIGDHPGPLRLLRNTPTGLVLDSAAFPSVAVNSSDVHLVDLNGDGDLDLVVASNGEPLRVFSNDGAGAFTQHAAYVINNNGTTYKVAIGDANGDGRPDVYMANSGLNSTLQGEDLLLLGDGNGGLLAGPAGALPPLRTDSIGATFVDIDGDGDQDIAVANFGTPCALLLNNGAGVYSDVSSRLPAHPGSGSTAIEAADVNGDGHMDLFVCHEGTSAQGLANALWLNDGAGSFTDGSALLPGNPDASFNARFLDVDVDGDMDLLISNLRGTQQIWINDAGTFTDRTSTNYPALNTVSDSLGLAFGDFNNDRAVDVIHVRRGDLPLLLLNTPR